MAFSLSGLTSLFTNQGIQAIGAGLLSGVIGGTALVTTGIIPVGDSGEPAGTIELLACPNTGPALARISDGSRLLVTGRSEDGAWLEVYIGQPGIDRAWMPATSLDLQESGDALPVVECAAPPPDPIATLGPPATSTPEPTSTATPSPSPSVTASATASATPSASATPRATPRATPSKTPTPTASKTPSPSPSKTPSPSPSPTQTPDPTVNPGPSLTDLDASSPNFCATGDSTISVTASDPQGIQFVRIQFTPTGGPTYGPYNMNHQGGGVYTYVIIPSGFNEGFVSITVTSSDGDGALSQISNANDQSHPAYLYASLFC